jgi:Protein of unknown function (DUF1565)
MNRRWESGVYERAPWPYTAGRRRHYGAGRLAVLFVLASIAAILFGLVSSCGNGEEAGGPNASAATAGAGQDFYVSVGGNDSNDGSSERPWATIQRAADEVAPGDTVHVRPGLYSSAIKSLASGTPSARIRFISDVKWGAKIIARSSYTAWENRGDYVDIAGFDITGDGNLGILNLGSFVRIAGNHVHDIPAKCSADGGAGIDHGNFAGHDNDTIGNLVHNIGDINVGCPRVHGIYHANLRGHLWNNIAFNNQGYGIHLWHAPVDVVVANNLVFHNGDGGITVGAGDAPGGVTADGMVVTNNILIENGTSGAGWAIVESGRIGTGNHYSNNIIWRNRRGIALERGRDAGTINADPRLLRYATDGSGDYHLAVGSPAIGAGTQAGSPPIDFDGRSRPAGQAIDIGPYAFSNASPAWPF